MTIETIQKEKRRQRSQIHNDLFIINRLFDWNICTKKNNQKSIELID
jgi:hypothetical protein